MSSNRPTKAFIFTNAGMAEVAPVDGVVSLDVLGGITVRLDQLATPTAVVHVSGTTDCFVGLDAMEVLRVANEWFVGHARYAHDAVAAVRRERFKRRRRQYAGQEPKAQNGRHVRNLVHDNETLEVWDRYNGDASAAVRHLIKTHGLGVAPQDAT